MENALETLGLITSLMIGGHAVDCEAVSFLPSEGASASVVCQNADPEDYALLRSLNRSFAQNTVSFEVPGQVGTPGETVALQSCILSILQPGDVKGQMSAQFAQFDCTG
ncbi:hypothetical protein [Woodsholea maritima]|uniref:hypothetical protein n=1 Tax=Woodsholea maritima TaxID=240237 RepID=UPI00036257E0|nr:hypothetical protein [Woodsholea maritima]